MNRLVKRLSRYILEEHMAEVRITLQQILFKVENEYRVLIGETPYLNEAELESVPQENRKWEIIPGVYGAPQVYLDKEGKLAAKGESVAVKYIVNRDTLEIRQFVSKFTDEAETRGLPG